MSRHVSADELANYRENAVRPRKAASIRTHLSGCARCSGIDAGLASVSTLLAGTYAPPMPERLADRVAAAIASESAARAAATPVLAAGQRTAGVAGAAAPAVIPGRPDLPDRSRHRARRLRMPDLSSPLLLRGLAAAGAVVIIAGAGFLFANNLTSPTSSPGAGGTGTRPAPRSRNLSRNAQNVIPLHYRQNGKIVTTNAVAADVNFTHANLAAQVRTQVASSATGFAASGASVPSAAPETGTAKRVGLVSVSTLEGCLTRVAAGQKVVLAEVARYLGKPATIIVLQPLTAAGVFDVAVVGLACSASASNIIARAEVAKMPTG